MISLNVASEKTLVNDCCKYIRKLNIFIEWLRACDPDPKTRHDIIWATNELHKLEMRCSEHCGNTVREAQ
jgi:hypothetical protein